MSNRYKGGIISATPPTTTGGESGTASGAWTLEQQMQAQAAGLWPIQPPPLYIENVFSTWLYSGNGATQTITNGINITGKGGLVWIKQRSATRDNLLFDTTRGATQRLFSNLTLAQSQDTQSLTAFNANGFSIGSDSGCNINGGTYASWTFRKQEKFFDCVTYSGNGVAGRTVAHNLGAVPGCIIVKDLTSTNNWRVYHRSLGATKVLVLNATSAEATSSLYWNDTAPTSTEFTLGTHAGVNANGSTYVAYLFAHNAGGFGLSGEDNVISCGSFTTDSGGSASITLGYEPQWMLVKAASTTSNWEIYDNMRGWSVGGDDVGLFANTSVAEDPNIDAGRLTATGVLNFTGLTGALNATYIYIAIRRGPMKTPTSGTSVFSPALGNGSAPAFTTGFPVDMSIRGTDSGGNKETTSRLLSGTGMYTNTTDAEFPRATNVFDYMTAWSSSTNGSNVISWNFRRAPGFFDEVCYSGNSTARTINHNLSAVPELMIVKARTGIARDWAVYTAATTATNFMYLNATDASGASSTMWNDTTPTASVFTVGTNIRTNNSGQDYVAYLFATCPGVSKVGSYTGTATTLQINCGFTTGARFVLIKRTDSTGDWYVWDSARGIVAGNDPYLLLNTTDAEVTGTDYVDTYSAGFEISSTAPAAINASGGTFIFLAIA